MLWWHKYFIMLLCHCTVNIIMELSCGSEIFQKGRKWGVIKDYIDTHYPRVYRILTRHDHEFQQLRKHTFLESFMYKNIEIKKKSLITIQLPREVELKSVPFFPNKINYILKHGVFLNAMQNLHVLCVCSKDMFKAVVLRNIYINRIEQ